MSEEQWAALGKLPGGGDIRKVSVGKHKGTAIDCLPHGYLTGPVLGRFRQCYEDGLIDHDELSQLEYFAQALEMENEGEK